MAGNGNKQLENFGISSNGWRFLKWQEMGGMAENAQKFLEMAGMADNCWKWQKWMGIFLNK